MRITLQIENVDRLETGGQVSYSCADRGFDIGRHEHLDWSLPDPHRVVSGKHCEVRFEGGQFVLYDISTNGTFLNGSPNRMDQAHVLRSGDRLMIGDYVISVALEAGESVGSGMGGLSSGGDVFFRQRAMANAAAGGPGHTRTFVACRPAVTATITLSASRTGRSVGDPVVGHGRTSCAALVGPGCRNSGGRRLEPARARLGKRRSVSL
ncbi:FHA domain-containing protein [Roseibium salinum]|nr:FHA domain-containing protein [Roseibium salinum]